MCGIAGYIGTVATDPLDVHRTLALMRNRGPDHQAHLAIRDGDTNVVLLHSRLSIVDLDPRSNQPFTIGDCTLVFNGEIYNYVELRRELEQRGVRFITTSDTEVLLQAYLAFGTACVDHFEGMWSFAIYDRRQRFLFLSRDRFAEKPLYYMTTPDGFYFGSEVKFLHALSGRRLQVNNSQILRFMVNGYKSLYKSGETFFTGISELPYASCLEVRHDLRPVSRRYWTPRCAPRDMTLEEAVEGFRHHLHESIRIRLRADVPLAFCLSGGVDSGAIASVAAKVFNYDVTTFSISDEDERYNEFDNIRATVDDLGCRHYIINIPRERTRARLERMIRYHDAPLLTLTYCIHSYLSELISANGFRVAVSGTAADELVTGYYDHFNLHLYEVRNHPGFETWLRDWREGPGRFVRNPHLQNPRLYFDSPGFRDHVYLNNDVFASFLNVDFAEAFSEERFCDSLLRNRMLNEMFHEVTPVILHEDDLNSMYHSVENRSPYLDSRLFDFACSIPGEYLIRDGYGKYVLREAVRGVLNDQVRLDKQKKGFNASFEALFDLDRPEDREFLLDDGPIFDLVQRDRIESMLGQETLPNSFSKFLFSFVSAKVFLDQWATGSSPDHTAGPTQRLDTCEGITA
jgi:asparagine synthase (glutamine-hydrolysing)